VRWVAEALGWFIKSKPDVIYHRKQHGLCRLGLCLDFSLLEIWLHGNKKVDKWYDDSYPILLLPCIKIWSLEISLKAPAN